MTIYLLEILVSLLATAGGQVLFKHYFHSRRRLDLVFAVSLFVLVPVTNYLALRGLSFGFVYMSSAVTQVIVLLMSRAFLGEKIGPGNWPGVALILAGIVIYAA